MRIISRVSAMSALAILGCFSACTSVLGINEPVEPDNNECRTFVCKDDVCKYQYSDFGIPCGGTNICSEFGECKTGTLQPCNQGLDCASGQCLDSLCRLNTEHRCMNDEECGVDICTDNICKHTDGSSCDQASECASGRCLNTCLGSDGSSCTDGTKCASGGCDPLTFTCKTSVGRTCQMDKECASGVCVQSLCSGQSCSGLTTGCGPKNESCCMSTEVTGGTYNRAHNTPSIPKDATISTFHLDRFEVTVGRFRKFVDAYPESKPKDGVGQHAQITGSAWNPEWDQYLPATRDALIASLKQCSQTNGEMPQPSWSDTVGMNENLPINCVSWYLAFAFCAWDGGRLPTEAEWGYAAIRDVQVSLFPSIYPWGNLPPDISYLTYNCEGNGASGDCELADLRAVGAASTKGDGKWGQADMAGSVFEWTLDGYNNTYPTPCTDCAELTKTTNRVRRGGGWRSTKDPVTTYARRADDPTTHDDMAGIRCAWSR